MGLLKSHSRLVICLLFLGGMFAPPEDALERYYLCSYTHTALLGLLIQTRVIDIARHPGQNPEWSVYASRP